MSELDTSEAAHQIATINEGVLKKPVDLVVMKPVGGVSIQRATRLIYNALIAHAQTEMSRLGAPMLSTETYNLHFSSLLKTVKLETSNFNKCKEYVVGLEDFKVVWESPNKTGVQVREAVHMLSQSKLTKKNGQFFLEFAFPPYVNNLIWSAVKNEEHALIMLRVLSSLGYVGLCLYEICAKFRGIPQTARKPPEWWQDALSQRGLGPDEKRREWRKFKSEKLKTAIEEINELTDLRIGLIEHRQGRNVVSVQFSLQKQRLQLNPIKFLPNMDLVERAVTLKVPEPKAMSLLKQHGDEKFEIALLKLANYKGSTPLERPWAYLSRCLSNVEEPQEQKALFEEKPDAIEHREVKPITSLDVRDEKTRSVDAIRKEILEELRAESEKVRRQYLEKAERLILESGMKLSSTEQLRLKEAKITASFLGSKALEIYAVEKYGSEWKSANVSTPIARQEIS